jgi:CTP synthase (UTP-ammonia lyase)
VPRGPPLPPSERRKIALFTNVEERAVITARDADDIYKIPMLLHERGSTTSWSRSCGLKVPPADLTNGTVVHAKAASGGRGRHRDGRQVRQICAIPTSRSTRR